MLYLQKQSRTQQIEAGEGPWSSTAAKALVAELVYDLKGDCDKSKMPNGDPTATTEERDI